MTKNRLSIEPIPDSYWRQTIKVAIGQTRWNQLSRECRALGRCWTCGSGSRLVAYPDTQYSVYPPVQTVHALIAQCQSCAGVRQIARIEQVARMKGDMTIFYRTVNHLRDVNSWTDEQAWAHMAQVAHWWQHNQGYQWRRDLTPLLQRKVAA